jgi:hypothetical protein
VLDPRKKYDPRVIWFRIVFLDRCLCLLLGLSQGCLDRDMASDVMLANGMCMMNDFPWSPLFLVSFSAGSRTLLICVSTDTPAGCLERIHCVIASHILERNATNPRSDDLNLTQTLDIDLQRAARSLPVK